MAPATRCWATASRSLSSNGLARRYSLLTMPQQLPPRPSNELERRSPENGEEYELFLPQQIAQDWKSQGPAHKKTRDTCTRTAFSPQLALLQNHGTGSRTR